MFIIDTNVISEIRKKGSGKADQNVIKWAESVDSSEIFLSSITILEIEIGILIAERKDKKKGAIFREWLHNIVIPEFKDRVLSFGLEEFLRCASLHVPDKCSERDSIICATAIVHNMTVVTRNVKDFPKGKVKLLNPWVFEGGTCPNRL